MKSLQNEVVSRDDVRFLLPRYTWLIGGMSERRHGNLRLNQNGSPMDALARAQFSIELEIPPERVIGSILVHGATVKHVTGKDLENVIEADGLVTREPNLFLSVTAADCLPIFFVDGQERIVGLAHAGWRGLLRGIVNETVTVMKEMESDPARIFAAIGPGIGNCHFEVGLAVARQFEKKLGADVVSRREGKLFVDLKKSAMRQLHRAGVNPMNIKTSEICTYCDERYFSHRRDATVGVEAMMAVIGIEG